jgi:hypothetical protein
MKIKYSPTKSNFDTIVETLPPDTVKIDGEEYTFDADSVSWPDIFEQTNGKIIEAHRDESGEMYLTIHRFYKDSCIEWDTGDYHEISW